MLEWRKNEVNFCTGNEHFRLVSMGSALGIYALVLWAGTTVARSGLMPFG